MSMKKWIVLFMAVFFCISMVGCAETGDGQNKNDAGTETGDGQGSEMGNPENRYIEVEK